MSDLTDDQKRGFLVAHGWLAAIDGLWIDGHAPPPPEWLTLDAAYEQARSEG